MPPETGDASESASRAARWATRRARARRITLVTAVVALVGGVTIATIAVVASGDEDSPTRAPGNLAVAHPTDTESTTTTTKPTTTTSTIPPLRQPKVVSLPDVPEDGLSWGSSGPVVAAYQQRLKKLHFDPGAIDGVYGNATNYAVTAAQKLLGLERDGRITPAVQAGLERFKFKPAKPKAEGNRVEIDLDTQVLTVYKRWQPILITTTSTGSGDHFCGGVDGCQYAITPTGKFHFYSLYKGWDKGKLGRMWNPYYFNGGIAVHGLESVPSYPASHGCARIPMDIATYFPTLVEHGEAVYVVGTPMKPGNRYVGPYTPPKTTTTTAPKTTTTKPGTKPTKPPKTTTTVRRPTTTTRPRPTTTPPAPTTSHT